MRILIVDNNVELCQILHQFLDPHDDFEVVGIAHDGEQALKEIQRLEPDLVLLDITMPYLDGLGVLEALKTMQLGKEPKVFVITAFGSDRLLSRLLALGADYFLVKPFRLEILVERLREFSAASANMILDEEALAQEPPLSVDQKVTQILHKMGVPPHLKGFAYLRDAVILYLREGYYAGGLTKEMYPALAEKYKTTMSGVEAGIRNALAAAWKHGNTEFIRKLCEPYCEDRMPTNSLIIAKIVEGSLGL
jgi:two-component system response regulator (stage 0 sporulation protein A)